MEIILDSILFLVIRHVFWVLRFDLSSSLLMVMVLVSSHALACRSTSEFRDDQLDLWVGSRYFVIIDKGRVIGKLEGDQVLKLKGLAIVEQSSDCQNG